MKDEQVGQTTFTYASGIDPDAVMNAKDKTGQLVKTKRYVPAPKERPGTLWDCSCSRYVWPLEPKESWGGNERLWGGKPPSPMVAHAAGSSNGRT